MACTYILCTGSIVIEDDEYAVNQEFQENAAQLADTLDLDEICAAKLLLDAEDHSDSTGSPLLASAVVIFHQRRQYLLETLRLVLLCSIDPSVNEDIQLRSREVLDAITGGQHGPPQAVFAYVQRCINSMSDVERWLQRLGERIQGSKALGGFVSTEEVDTVRFQQESLVLQHESLGAIVSYLVKLGYSDTKNFDSLLSYLPKLDRWNHLTIHYVPMILAFICHYGSPDGQKSLRQAREYHNRILDAREASIWRLPHFQAAVQSWWLAEYSGWYQEVQTGSPIQGVDLEAEAVGRSEAFFQVLKEGAFQCTLMICSQVTPDDWYDPARRSLISYLLRDAPSLQQDSGQASEWFRLLIMENLEIFVDAFITNMPDTLRRFKSEEDDQRKRFHSNLQPTDRSRSEEQDLHLERFLVIVSFSFDQRSEAADSFWSDTESNLYGFLQWASKRQSTPIVGAFCEMLRSISQGSECANAAHGFLLEESGSGPSRLRRNASLSWSQILGELSTYTSKIKDSTGNGRPITAYGAKPKADDIDEPESVLMLESYLRLMSHLCTESTEARSWVSSQANPYIIHTLFVLCNNTVPYQLQACSYKTIGSLLTSKTLETSLSVWTALDNWASGANAPSIIVKPAKMTGPAVWLEEITPSSIITTFDQANEFTALLLELVSPPDQGSTFKGQLPFPETLGSAYRIPGIEPYIDLVMQDIFGVMSQQLEEPSKRKLLTFNALDLVVICLRTFDEALLVMSTKSTIPVDEALDTSSLTEYVKLHPFCRTMEWLFNDRVLAALFTTSHTEIDDIAAAPPDSPAILSLQRCIDVMNLLMDLQSTYLNIVRPLMKDLPHNKRQPVANLSLASFEDSVASHLQLIVDLGKYAELGIDELTTASLKLLGKFASSRRLNAPPAQNAQWTRHGNLLVGIMEQTDDLERIRRNLSMAMEFNLRELEQGPASSGWVIKSIILEFLIQALSSVPDRPNLAHALLGFTCGATSIDVETDGAFANGSSLFHSILHLVAEYPDGNGLSKQLWALSLRQKGFEVLALLWQSRLTSTLVLLEMRALEFFFRLLLRQTRVDANTSWDERLLGQPDFLITDSAETVQLYIQQRCFLYSYMSTEIRLVSVEGPPSLQTRLSAALSGSTVTPEGELLSNMSIHELLDFSDLDFPQHGQEPPSRYFANLDLNALSTRAINRVGAEYDIGLLEEMVSLRLRELQKMGRCRDPKEEQQIMREVDQVLQHFQAKMNLDIISSVKRLAVSTWTDLLTLMVEKSNLPSDERMALILQALQVLTPKLGMFVSEDDSAVLDIANAIEILVCQFQLDSATMRTSHAADFAYDRLFQVFYAAVRSISYPEVSAEVREHLYSICYKYLTHTCNVQDAAVRRRYGSQVTKAMSGKFMDTVCDDAVDASPTCRITAILLLEALSTLAGSDGSVYVMNSLVQSNFIRVLVESIEDVAVELRETAAQGE